ncbi:Hexose phosphate uptake regulatory protein UhpC [Citrobacter freundii]|uniref:Hexose phosphate uptake regulatory protein UhpC n=1 Tax=Citrobacter freundii TaxID=546 RepID=A0A7G2IU15_CITFR|nr:Hexose phosphate uptake regulatory protein UhpC [Citrobacter freundii]
MFAFLKAPDNAPLITDKQEMDARYRYWRRHILTTIWLGYALFYFTRKSFNAAVPDILTSGVLTRSDIGLLATLFYITYGLSKFVSGIVSDRSNARYFMGIGLIATGVVNILLGFSTSLWAFAVLWALNAFFPGLGVAGLRAFIDRVVFAYRARRLVGAVEYRAQRRRGADPYRDGGDSAALRLARRDDDRWAAGDCGGGFPLLAAAR